MSKSVRQALEKTGLVSKRAMDSIKESFEYVDSYHHAKDIIDRTNEAVGRNLVYESKTGSTPNGKINTNEFAATRKI